MCGSFNITAVFEGTVLIICLIKQIYQRGQPMYLLIPVFDKRSCSCSWIWNASLFELTLPMGQEGKELLRCGII